MARFAQRTRRSERVFAKPCNFGPETAGNAGTPAYCRRRQGEPPHEGRRIPEIASRRRCELADRFRDRQARTRGPRHPRRREGDFGQSGRLQGPQARGTAGGRNQDFGLRRRRDRRRRRPRRHAVQAGRRGVLCRLDPAPGHQFGISPGRRAHRRPQAEDAFIRAIGRPPPNLDHRMGIAVRPPRRRARQERRSAHAPDHRRRRRRRLDPDPARAPPHRSDRRRHGVAARSRKNGASISAPMP